MPGPIANELSGKVALITGAAGGIGSSAARYLGGSGAAIVICDIQAAAGEAVAQSIRTEGGTAEFIALDVGSENGWRDAAGLAIERFGHVDILVNNVGVNDRKPLMETSSEDWERTLRANLTGAFLGMRAIVPHMRDRGRGAIVNVSSTAALVGHPDAPYSASKWGLRGLTRTAALEFVAWGIRVNSVHPGSVPTALHNNAPPGHAEVWRKLIPMGRAGQVNEIAEAVLFLASDRSSYMTGSEIVVDGGLTSGGLLNARKRLLEEFEPHA